MTACFGVICEDESVTVTPGAAVDLVVTPLTATITADETLELSADELINMEMPYQGRASPSLQATVPWVERSETFSNRMRLVDKP